MGSIIKNTWVVPSSMIGAVNETLLRKCRLNKDDLIKFNLSGVSKISLIEDNIKKSIRDVNSEFREYKIQGSILSGNQLLIQSSVYKEDTKFQDQKLLGVIDEVLRKVESIINEYSWQENLYCNYLAKEGRKVNKKLLISFFKKSLSRFVILAGKRAKYTVDYEKDTGTVFLGHQKLNAVSHEVIVHTITTALEFYLYYSYPDKTKDADRNLFLHNREIAESFGKWDVLNAYKYVDKMKNKYGDKWWNYLSKKFDIRRRAFSHHNTTEYMTDEHHIRGTLRKFWDIIYKKDKNRIRDQDILRKIILNAINLKDDAFLNDSDMVRFLGALSATENNIDNIMWSYKKIVKNITMDNSKYSSLSIRNRLLKLERYLESVGMEKEAMHSKLLVSNYINKKK